MAIDWTKSMKQTYEFYVVDPVSWQDTHKLTNCTSAEITREEGSELLETASISVTDELIGEAYIRIYLIVEQNHETMRIPLCTTLAQTPSFSFDGKVRTQTMNGSSPLIELKDKKPPIGYYIPRKTNLVDAAQDILRAELRAPISGISYESFKVPSDFTANFDDSWLAYITDLLKQIGYKIALEPTGEVIFRQDRLHTAKTPVWRYNDDNSSILMPSVSVDRDITSIPNVVEVVYSKDNANIYAIVKNTNSSSPTSISSRGREIVQRISDPEFSSTPTKSELKAYAKKVLDDNNDVVYKISYTHGYCPVRVGDCVMLNYERAGIHNVIARVVSQRISCVTGCTVEETAVYTKSIGGSGLSENSYLELGYYDKVDIEDDL